MAHMCHAWHNYVKWRNIALLAAMQQFQYVSDKINQTEHLDLSSKEANNTKQLQQDKNDLII